MNETPETAEKPASEKVAKRTITIGNIEVDVLDPDETLLTAITVRLRLAQRASGDAKCFDAIQGVLTDLLMKLVPVEADQERIVDELAAGNITVDGLINRLMGSDEPSNRQERRHGVERQGRPRGGRKRKRK